MACVYGQGQRANGIFTLLQHKNTTGTKEQTLFIYMENKRVYLFGNGSAEGNASMRNLLGGKGANVAEMNLLEFQFLQDSPSQRICVTNTTASAKRLL